MLLTDGVPSPPFLSEKSTEAFWVDTFNLFSLLYANEEIHVFLSADVPAFFVLRQRKGGIRLKNLIPLLCCMLDRGRLKLRLTALCLFCGAMNLGAA